MTFAILGQSFIDAGESSDFVEGVKRRIIEYGGKVVRSTDRANYVVHEDGYREDIWRLQEMNDEMNRNIVHYRWVDDCITNQGCFIQELRLDMYPLPHKVPSIKL